MTQPTQKSILLIIILSIVVLGCESSSGTDDENEVSNFESGRIGPGESFSHTFNQEGTQEYYCELHAPDMQGQITVTSSVNSSERDTVFMTGDRFQPSSLSIAPNTELIWINQDSHDHTVVSGNPSSNDGGSGY